MDYKEAKERFKSFGSFCDDRHDACDENCKKCSRMEDRILEAMNRQIPKKPTIISDGENLCAHCECGQHLDWTYPGSNGMWRNGKTHKFCLNCGQKIDWEVECK